MSTVSISIARRIAVVEKLRMGSAGGLQKRAAKRANIYNQVHYAATKVSFHHESGAVLHPASQVHLSNVYCCRLRTVVNPQGDAEVGPANTSNASMHVLCLTSGFSICDLTDRSALLATKQSIRAVQHRIGRLLVKVNHALTSGSSTQKD